MPANQTPHISHIEQKGKFLQVVWGAEQTGTGGLLDGWLEVNYPSGQGGIYRRRVSLGGTAGNKYCRLDNIPLPISQNVGEMNFIVNYDSNTIDDYVETSFTPNPTIPQSDSVAVTEINGFPDAAPPGDTFTVEAVIENANNAPVICDVEFTYGDGSGTWAQTETVELEANADGNDNVAVVTKDVTMPNSPTIEDFCVDITNLDFWIPDFNIHFPDYGGCDRIVSRDDDLHPDKYTMTIDEVPESFTEIDDRISD